MRVHVQVQVCGFHLKRWCQVALETKTHCGCTMRYFPECIAHGQGDKSQIMCHEQQLLNWIRNPSTQLPVCPQERRWVAVLGAGFTLSATRTGDAALHIVFPSGPLSNDRLAGLQTWGLHV